MSIAILIQYMARGTRQMELLLSIRPLRWIGIGLLCAAMTGAGAGLFGYPFLSSHFHYADVPLVGAVPVASAIFFDLGVFALVVGATVLILIDRKSTRLNSSH